MRLKLVRCFICSAWYGGMRNHCPHCAASRIVVGNGAIHLNSLSGLVMASGLSRYRFMAHALEIANELMTGRPVRD
jgi:hypothetical protein